MIMLFYVSSNILVTHYLTGMIISAKPNCSAVKSKRYCKYKADLYAYI